MIATSSRWWSIQTLVSSILRTLRPPAFQFKSLKRSWNPDDAGCSEQWVLALQSLAVISVVSCPAVPWENPQEHNPSFLPCYAMLQWPSICTLDASFYDLPLSRLPVSCKSACFWPHVMLLCITWGSLDRPIVGWCFSETQQFSLIEFVSLTCDNHHHNKDKEE